MPSAKSRVGPIALVLFLATMVLYARTFHFDFVNYDDPVFVTENPIVRSGLTMDGLVLAFTTAHADYWRPLSWVSHMMDVELFGMHAGFHHLTNVLWHSAAAGALFFAMRALTGALWPSAFVAALFAWHPLRVESVAWIAERKDVMCGCFWFLTLWAYAHYAMRLNRRWYLATFVLFLLGLMSKPMIITLPFQLLLLDFWPLRRMPWPRVVSVNTSQPRGRPSEPSRAPAASVTELLSEKIPFFAAAVCVAVSSFYSVHDMGAMATLPAVSLSSRLVNCVVSYATYVAMLFWPANLAVLYPLPPTWPVWRVVVSAMLVISMTYLAISLARTRPYILAGWLWFITILLPVIGLVQAGEQVFADRYTYVPCVGLFMAAVWLALDGLKEGKNLRGFLPFGAGAAVIACIVATSLQLSHWQNSVTLFEHALKVTQNNPVAHANLSGAFLEAGRFKEAAEQAAAALRLRPDFVVAENNLGAALAEAGKFEEAAAHFAAVLRLRPNRPDTLINLATLSSKVGRHSEARAYFASAVANGADPVTVESFVGQFSEKARRQPDDFEAWYNLGSALTAAGRNVEAISALENVVRLKPDYADPHIDLGIVLAKQNRLAEAVEQFHEGLRLNPNSFEGHSHLARVLFSLGRTNEARLHDETANSLHPKSGGEK